MREKPRLAINSLVLAKSQLGNEQRSEVDVRSSVLLARKNSYAKKMKLGPAKRGKEPYEMGVGLVPVEMKSQVGHKRNDNLLMAL